MHITDDLDRFKGYDPLIDTEVDLDAPYIDFRYAENLEEIEVPKTGVWDTLFYEKTKIFICNEISEAEVRFYSSETPNEKYRVGQKHVKGKVMSMSKINDADDGGFIIKFDASVEYYGKIKTLGIDRKYVEATHARCIAIIYFDGETGRPTGEELIIPIEDWFSTKVYINTAVVSDKPEEYPYQVDDIVDLEYYRKIDTDIDKGEFKVELQSITGRIASLKELYRLYMETDENGIMRERTAYYYEVTIDTSTLYDFNQFSIASNVIKKMIMHDFHPY